MKTTNLLLLCGAAYFGFKLIPEDVKEELPFGGGTNVSILTENPFDWEKLTGLLGKVQSDMPFPDMPEWLQQSPDWFDKIKDVTLPPMGVPEWLINQPDWLVNTKEWWDKAQAVVNPDTAGVLPDLTGIADTIIDALTPNRPPSTKTPASGGGWWQHLTGGWQDVYDFLNPFDIAKHFYNTDAWKADKLLTEYARNVVPRPEKSYRAPTGIIIESGYRPIMPFANPRVPGTEIVGIIGGTPVSRLVRDKPKPPPTTAKWWHYT